MNFLEKILFNRITKANDIKFEMPIEDLEKIVVEKRMEINNYLNQNNNIELQKLKNDFSVYTVILERVILERRLESGISTLIYYIYTILGNIAGILMSILVFFSTRGYVGHIILLISIAGGVFGIIIAIKSMRKERKFLITLKNGI